MTRSEVVALHGERDSIRNTHKTVGLKLRDTDRLLAEPRMTMEVRP